jgi:hypothetical protein
VRLTHVDRALPQTDAVDSDQDLGTDSIVSAANQLQELDSMISAGRQKISDREMCWEALKEKIQKLADQAKGKVSLDVGGKIFSTTQKSLSGSEFFSAMATRWEPDEDGHYFIDKVLSLPSAPLGSLLP